MNKINEHFKALFDKTREITGVGVWYVDLIQNTVTWDNQTKKIHEVPMSYEPNLEVGINFFKEGESRDKITKLVNNLIEKGEPYNTELQVITAKGKERWVRAIAQPDYDTEMNLKGFFGTFQNIDKEKKEYTEIALLKERLTVAADASEAGIWDWDILKDELTWDDQMYNLYQLNKKDFEGAYQAWTKVLHPDDLKMAQEAVNNAVLGNKEFDTQFRIITPAGEIKHIKAKAKVVRNKDMEPIRMIGSNWDVTNEVNQYSKIVNYSSTMKVVQEAVKMFYWKWDPVTNEAEWDDLMYEFYDIPLNHPDKIAIWETRLEPDVVAIIWHELVLTVEGKHKYDRTFKVTVRGEEKYVRGLAEVVYKPDGSVDYLVGINMDVTDQVIKSKELEKKNESLEELTEKLKLSNEKLEEFAYIASHDLKTPIRNMSNLATFLDQDYGEQIGGEGKEFIEGIQKQAQKMTKLVDDLLTFSRVNKIKINKSLMNINDLINESIDLLGDQFLSEVSIEIDDLGKLKVDAVKFREVFNNLITNAVKYNMSKKKTIKVWREKDVIYFKDNGIGISPKDKEKVFGFFRRLHGNDEFGGGTGAGMAIVKNVLERHDVNIDYESELGKGTTFILDCKKCVV